MWYAGQQRECIVVVLARDSRNAAKMKTPRLKQPPYTGYGHEGCDSYNGVPRKMVAGSQTKHGHPGESATECQGTGGPKRG